MNDIEKARRSRQLRTALDELKSSCPATNLAAMQLPQCTMVREWLEYCKLHWYSLYLVVHELSPTREQMSLLRPQLENLNALTRGYIAHHCKLHGVEKLEELSKSERLFFHQEFRAFVERHDHFIPPEKLTETILDP